MSYTCGTPSMAASTMPIAAPSSCECTTSYRVTHARRTAVSISERSSGTLTRLGPIRTRRTNGGRTHRNTRRPVIETSCPNGYVTRSTVWPSSRSARMRWYSLNGVPRGSKKGSGAIIRMCMDGRPSRPSCGAGASRSVDCNKQFTVHGSRFTVLGSRLRPRSRRAFACDARRDSPNAAAPVRPPTCG